MTEPIRRSLRVLKVLEILSTAGHPQTLSQLAYRSGVPKSSLMRMLDDLEHHQYVIRVPGKGGYVPGHKAHHLAIATLQAPELLRACRDVLIRLVGQTGETCNLNVMVGDSVKYLAREESPGYLRLQLRLPVGTHVPLHCTASGKLFMAMMPDLALKPLLKRIDLKPLTPKTITERPNLETALRTTRAQKLNIDDKEFVAGMVAVAVPVCDQDGVMRAALACHAPTACASLRDLHDHVPHLRRAAYQLADILFS